MDHLLTLSLDDLPELREQLGAGDDAAAISLFVSDRDDNGAYAGNSETKVLILTKADVKAGGKKAKDVEGHAAQAIRVTRVEVPEAVFAEEPAAELEELQKRIYGLGGRALGEPLWLQDPQDGAGAFVLQFDENLVDTNLGDSGVMYVFGDDAFWQCH